jgi:hypothetical protein
MATTPLLRAQTREETSLWESIKDSKDAEDYKAYLDKYPEGVYAPLAKRRVAQLEAHPSQQAPNSSLGMKKDLTAAQAPSTAVPTAMTECEGTNNCATWTFLGGQGNGQWPSGEIANLTVERYDDKTVTIRRADSTGASAGATTTVLVESSPPLGRGTGGTNPETGTRPCRKQPNQAFLPRCISVRNSVSILSWNMDITLFPALTVMAVLHGRLRASHASQSSCAVSIRQALLPATQGKCQARVTVL